MKIKNSKKSKKESQWIAASVRLIVLILSYLVVSTVKNINVLLQIVHDLSIAESIGKNIVGALKGQVNTITVSMMVVKEKWMAGISVICTFAPSQTAVIHESTRIIVK